MKEKINGLEKKLSGTLRPVAPRTEFVRGLGRRIQSLRNTVVQARADTWQFVLLMLAGFLSLGVALAVLGRALFTLLGVRKQQPREP